MWSSYQKHNAVSCRDSVLRATSESFQRTIGLHYDIHLPDTDFFRDSIYIKAEDIFIHLTIFLYNFL